MGADLIGYMAKGPKVLKFSKAKATKFFKAHAKKDETGTLVMLVDAVPGYHDEQTPVTLTDFLDQANSFVGEWNSCNYRDMVWCAFPSDNGKKVVFAGELSWGDTPEGAGYQMMEVLFQYHLDELYGIE